jgi:hypothetical protein
MGFAGTLTWIALCAWVVLALWWWRGMRRMPILAELPDASTSAGLEAPLPGGWPTLTMVVAARDEAPTIAAALRTWLAQDYAGLEIVIVDDRSRDGTLDVVERVLDAHQRTAAATAQAASRGPTVRCLRVDELPEGWLGKVHAQARGAALGRGAWLLFADADVRMAPGALRTAMAAALRSGADHLALLPRFDAPRGWSGHLVLAFEVAFALLLTVLVRPWRAPDPRTPTTLGIGAFGLYRRSAYERSGGHAAVRMRPDDDLALAASVKRAGGSSLVAFGPSLAAVTWYPTLAAALRGLEKNAFAGLRYSVPLVALVGLALLATHVLPFGVALAGSGPARYAGVAVVAVVAVVYAWYGRRSGTPAWYAVLHPVSVTALVWAMVRSMVATLRSGSIEWRGTSYDLADLRAARARDVDRRHEPHAAGRGREPRRQRRKRPRT